jgi:Zn-dependent peptidase ImmA (M78 family)
MTYDDLLDEATAAGLRVAEEEIPYDGYICGCRIAVNSRMPTAYKKCALAEEIGHARLSVGNILDQTEIENQKQEHTARGWAYEHLIPVEHIRFAMQDGYSELWEIAEYIDISEPFLIEAIAHYKSKGLL